MSGISKAVRYFVDVGVEVEGSLLDELHDRCPGEEFGDRSGREHRRLGLDRHVGADVGVPVPLGHFTVLDDGDGGTHDAEPVEVVCHQLVDEGLDRLGVRFRSVLFGCCRWDRHKTYENRCHQRCPLPPVPSRQTFRGPTVGCLGAAIGSDPSGSAGSARAIPILGSMSETHIRLGRAGPGPIQSAPCGHSVQVVYEIHVD